MTLALPADRETTVQKEPIADREAQHPDPNRVGNKSQYTQCNSDEYKEVD